MTTRRPLVTELSETLVQTDLTLETFWSAFRHNPIKCLYVCCQNLFDQTELKRQLYAIGPVDVSLLPYNRAVISKCCDTQAAGAEVFVASIADQSLAEDIVDYISELDVVLPAGDQHSNDGHSRCSAIVRKFGQSGFDYIGGGIRDLPALQNAKVAYVARPAPSLTGALQAKEISAQALGYRWQLRDMVRGLRPHQWTKNLLLFLPLIAAHQLDAKNTLAVLLGIVCFSAAASAIYIVNDLLDLDADRRHPTKRNRVFASGKVPIRIGMASSLLLASFAIALAANMAKAMFLVVSAYLVLTVAYSVFFKRYRWVDLILLSSLYSLRVIAGAIAAGVVASPWLMAFVMPAFLALAAVKRLTELRKLPSGSTLPGRAYSQADSRTLLGLAIIGATMTIGVFCAYTVTWTASVLYVDLWELRIMALPMSLWFAHMILTGWKGRQSYDPMVFALRDAISLVLLTLIFLFAGFATSGNP